MGIIKAAGSAISGALADTWLEVYEADDMGDQVLFTKGVQIRQGQNKKGASGTVSNGSMIHVYPNQFMILLDGGKVVDYTAEPGYYKVDNSSLPSLFNGQFGDSLKETFDRIKYGGETLSKQQVYYINLQEIKGIKFGTRNPVNYFDNFYNAELFLRAHGSYSIKVTDPLKFYAEVIPKNDDHVEVNEINEQYLNEFLEAFQSALNQMSADGIRVSHVTAKSRELGKYMSAALDEEWTKTRGMEIQAVGVGGISYDDESKELINLRNQGAMLSDPAVREGYVQGSIARGMEAAGSNSGGAMTGFMGMGIGMQSAGGFMSAASQTNAMQMQMQNQQAQAAQPAKAPSADGWTCACGTVNKGKFCSECGQPRPASGEWICSCGAVNKGKFCSECGQPRPASGEWTCNCGTVNKGKFCENCGTKRP